jgi:hypothetical protein
MSALGSKKQTLRRTRHVRFTLESGRSRHERNVLILTGAMSGSGIPVIDGAVIITRFCYH